LPDKDVFVNCPFDHPYRRLHHALIFVVHDCGFRARSALEVNDSGEVRIRKIVRLIGSSPFAIHDISRTQLDRDTRLPRFNMPLELGIFLGAAWFGNRAQRRKRCLVLDRERYRFQAFCSDIAGQDIAAHEDDVETLIRVVRNWLNGMGRAQKPGGPKMFRRFESFRRDLPHLCDALGESVDSLEYKDYLTFVTQWLQENP
jgi:hypothetical protein